MSRMQELFTVLRTAHDWDEIIDSVYARRIVSVALDELEGLIDLGAYLEYRAECSQVSTGLSLLDEEQAMIAIERLKWDPAHANDFRM